MHAAVSEDALFICAYSGNEVKLFQVKGDEGVLVGSMEVDTPKSVTIHPSSTGDAVRILVGTESNVLLLRCAGEKMEVVAKLQDEQFEDKYTVGAMHPDGLIYAVGTEGGKLVVWDLKTQSVAMTLDVSQFMLVLVSCHVSSHSC
jgi:pre-mRNA-processing factor 19